LAQRSAAEALGDGQRLLEETLRSLDLPQRGRQPRSFVERVHEQVLGGIARRLHRLPGGSLGSGELTELPTGASEARESPRGRHPGGP